MIEFLRFWVQNIVYIIIFVVFLEILLPSNSMRKYVKVVAGLLVMVVILTPITQLFTKEFNIQDVMAKHYSDMNQIDIKNQHEVLEGQQSEMTMRIYKDRIALQMEKQLEKEVEGLGVEVAVEVFTDPEKENYGAIKEVRVYLSEQKEEDNEIKTIEKIIIGKDIEKQEEKDNEEQNIISKEKKREIKEFFLDFYNVPIENISINIQKNTMEKGER